MYILEINSYVSMSRHIETQKKLQQTDSDLFDRIEAFLNQMGLLPGNYMLLSDILPIALNNASNSSIQSQVYSKFRLFIGMCHAITTYVLTGHDASRLLVLWRLCSINQYDIMQAW